MHEMITKLAFSLFNGAAQLAWFNYVFLIGGAFWPFLWVAWVLCIIVLAIPVFIDLVNGEYDDRL